MGNTIKRIVSRLVPRDLLEVIAADDVSEYARRYDEFDARWPSSHNFLTVLRNAEAYKICKLFTAGMRERVFEMVSDQNLLFIYDSCHSHLWLDNEIKRREPRLRSYFLTKGYTFPVREKSLSDIYYALTIGQGPLYVEWSSTLHDTVYYTSTMLKLHSLMITPLSVGKVSQMDKKTRMNVEDHLLLYEDASLDTIFYEYRSSDKQPWFTRLPWIVRASVDGNMTHAYIKCFYTQDRDGRLYHGENILKLLKEMGIKTPWM